METAVSFEQVRKRFGEVDALAGLSFSVSKGTKTALLGPNGAGKSTAISLMLGLRAPSSGKVTVLARAPGHARQLGGIGAMLQEAGLPPGIGVRELVSFYRRLFPSPLPLEEIISRAMLGEFAHRRVERLSGGQRQRLLYALAIAGDPQLLFLDEPTAGLDAEARRFFWQSLDDLAAQGRTILFTTHYLEEADAHAEEVLVIQRGRLLAQGSPATLKQAAGVRTIRLRATPEAAERVRRLFGDAACAVGDGQVTIAVPDPEPALSLLLAAGVPLRDLEVGSGTLEDALLQLGEANG